MRKHEKSTQKKTKISREKREKKKGDAAAREENDF
jgi:hypothetical protein